jgi:hypothetical protein
MPKPHPLPKSNGQVRLEGTQVCLVSPKQRPRWNQLVRRHHYLKNANLGGEQLRYAVTDANGNWLALLGWSAAAPEPGREAIKGAVGPGIEGEAEGDRGP